MNEKVAALAASENRARVLVASSAREQFRQAAALLKAATGNLEAIRFGVEAPLKHAREACRAADIALVQTEQLLARIP